MVGSSKERFGGRDYPVSIESFPFLTERIMRAYHLGKKTHEGQTRKTTGEPYFNHCVAVAGIVESWICVGSDESVFQSRFVEDLVIAALMHDTVEDTELTLEDIRKEFGDEVAFLVDGVSKFKSEGVEGSDHETLKKVARGYFVDPRVVIIKLADRGQNMESLGDMPVHKRAPKAWETEEVYARMAQAMGMWIVMRDLRDSAYPHLDPENFQKTKEVLAQDKRRDPEHIAEILNYIQHVVGSSGIECKVGYRLAGYRQIEQKRKKILRKRIGGGLGDVSDVVSVGITVKSEEDCYAMLRILRSNMREILDPTRSADFIQFPADNGFQVLREVADFGTGAVEIVVMTDEMEEFNNWGVVSLIRAGVEDLAEYRMKIVFTPDDEIRVLPLQATGWDVAAAISPDLATRMVSLLVDGNPWPLSMQIPHAVEVKVIAGRRGVYLENKTWMTAALPETRRLLRQGEREVQYKNIVNAGVVRARVMLAKRGVLSFTDIRSEITLRLSELGCGDIGQLFYRIGTGEMTQEILDQVLDGGDIPITKETLGLSTVMVRGKDQVGILNSLTGLITQMKGNIVRVVNDDDNGTFEIRVVIKGLSADNEKKLRKLLTEDDRFSEVLVV